MVKLFTKIIHLQPPTWPLSSSWTSYRPLPCCPWWRTWSTPWLLSSGMLQCCGRLCPHPVNKCLPPRSPGASAWGCFGPRPPWARALRGSSGTSPGLPWPCGEVDILLEDLGMSRIIQPTVESSIAAFRAFGFFSALFFNPMAKMLAGMRSTLSLTMASTSTGCHTSTYPLFFVSWLLLLGHQMQNVHRSTVLSWVWKI